MNRESFFINVWTTLRCNYRCRYCYVSAKYSNKDLDINIVDDIIEFIRINIKNEQDLIINFHGGEPTLNFHVIKYFVNEVRKIITNNKIVFGITTNGSLLNDEMINFIGENFLYNVSISLDGKEKTNNYNRIQVGEIIEFDKILNNAKKLLNFNENLRIRMTYDRKNIMELYENIIFFIENGFKIVVPVADFYSDKWKDQDFKLVEEQFKRVKEYINRNKLADIDIYEIKDEFRCLSPCSAGEDYYNIDVYGDIYGCTLLAGNQEFKIGNVYEGINIEKIKYIKNINQKKLNECEGCQMYNFCKSTRCLLVNYATTGDFYKPNLVFCNMLNIKLNLSKNNSVVLQ